MFAMTVSGSGEDSRWEKAGNDKENETLCIRHVWLLMMVESSGARPGGAIGRLA